MEGKQVVNEDSQTFLRWWDQNQCPFEWRVKGAISLFTRCQLRVDHEGPHQTLDRDGSVRHSHPNLRPV